MGKTYKRNQQFKPKKNGKVFVKEHPSWKKTRHEEGRDVRHKNYTQDYDRGTE
jgi:hypothetical protein